jgi:hypothetical protein
MGLDDRPPAPKAAALRQAFGGSVTRIDHFLVYVTGLGLLAEAGRAGATAGGAAGDRRVERAFLNRVRRLPQAARAWLLVAAA